MSRNKIFLAITLTLLFLFSGCPATSNSSVPDRVITIASIGESYASGEGNPDLPAVHPNILPDWDFAQCHRSRISGRYQAAERISRMDGITVIHANFACSGSGINRGLLGGFDGRGLLGGFDGRGLLGGFDGYEINGVPQPELDSQIDQLKDWLVGHGIQNLDVLLISVGGNDIGFNNVVAACISPVPIRCDIQGGPNNLGEIVQNGEPGVDPEQGLLIGLSNLKDAFSRLADEIDVINPGHVLITEYPDPLRDENGAFCHNFDDDFVVLPANLFDPESPPVPVPDWFQVGAEMALATREENEWVYDEVLIPLNQEILSAAGQHGWEYVGGMLELTMKHGYCSEHSWFRTLKQSWNLQLDVFGGAHPNEIGHMAYEHLIVKRIAELLDLNVQNLHPVINEQETRMGRLMGEIEDYQLAPYDPGTVKRVAIEFWPNPNQLAATLSYSYNGYASNFIDTASVPASRKQTGFQPSITQSYYADLPGSEALDACDWIHYRWTYKYGPWDGQMLGTYIGPLKEVQLYNYDPVFPNINPCDPIPEEYSIPAD